MPWTIYIRRKDGATIGPIDEVRTEISHRLPGVKFWRDPSGAEKAEHMPEQHRKMFAELFGHLPAAVRGLYESNQLSFEFFLGSNDVVETFTVDIRGNGNPLDILRRIATDTDWQVEGPNGDPIDLTQRILPGWTEFTEYRDSAIVAVRNQAETE